MYLTHMNVQNKSRKPGSYCVNWEQTFILIVVCLVTVACSDRSRESEVAGIYIAEETLHAARSESFPYRDTLQSAVDGDHEAIRMLLEFGAETDAAATLGHRKVLKELEGAVGRSTMLSVIENIDADFLQYVQWIIDGDPPL